jgi:hypothetical protein
MGDQIVMSLLVSLAAMLTGQALRQRRRARSARETARLVEAERIVSLLSGRQPGVWDQDDLRDRVESTARELWSAPDREAIARVAMWAEPPVVEREIGSWPASAVRREATVRFSERASFVQVQEGGDADRVVARLRASWEASWFDARGKRVKREVQRLFRSYHAWVHIDGLGWQLRSITLTPPLDEAPPSSVSCRILPVAAETESKSQP